MIDLAQTMVSQFAPACPCCGQSNPKSYDLCQGCGERLKPEPEPVALSFVHQRGLEYHSRMPVEQSLSLRRLTLAVSYLECGEIGEEEFEGEVMAVLGGVEQTIRGFAVLARLKELPETFLEVAEMAVEAAELFREACFHMVEVSAREGLEAVEEALVTLDGVEQFAREVAGLD